MANFIESAESGPIKLFMLGEPGSGKTGAVLSLAAAGYNVRVLDFDNGVQVLRGYLTNPASPYRREAPGLWTKAQADSILQRVSYETITDSRRNVGGVLIPKASTVWQRATKLLDNWPEFGPVSAWGAKDILVIDSLTFLSKAIMRWVLSMNGRINTRPHESDYGQAQEMIMSFIEMLYSSEIGCNVIYNCHIKQFKLGKKEDSKEDILSKGYPETIGRAISPSIGRYVNNILLAHTVGTGRSAKKRISTVGTDVIELKTTAPLMVKPDYDLTTGLAELFAALGAKPTTT